MDGSAVKSFIEREREAGKSKNVRQNSGQKQARGVWQLENRHKQGLD